MSNLIAMVTTCFPRWKNDHSGHFVYSLAKHLSEVHPVTIVAPDHPEVDDNWLPETMRVVRFKWPGWSQNSGLAYGHGIAENLKLSPSLICQVPLFLYSMKKALKHVCKRSRLSCVIAHWIVPCGWIASSVVRENVQLISICHGSDLHLVERCPGPVRSYLIRTLLSKTDHFVAVSTDLQTRLTGLMPPGQQKPIQVIPMGPSVDIPIEQMPPQTQPHNQCPQLLYMGRLIPVKGVDFLLKALAEFPGETTLHIAGDGPERPSLERLSTNLEVTAKFHGHVSGTEKQNLLAQVNVGIIPSLVASHGQTDGSPTVFLEYMESGLPVMASNTGGLSDIGRHRENCLFFEPNDSTSFHESLNLLLSDSELQSQLISGGNETASHYNWRSITSQFLRTIQTQQNRTKHHRSHHQ